MEVVAEKIVRAISDNYNYNFAQWQPNKIQGAIEIIDKDIAGRLNYSDSESLLNSIRQQAGVDLTPFIVKYNYPVWACPVNDPKPNPLNKTVVITYLPPGKENFLDGIERIREYASRINADFVLLEGRTQGSILLEKFRIKPFVEAYDRTIFFHYTIAIKEGCPNLFDIVPEDKIGIYDNAKEIPNNSDFIKHYKKRRLRILKADIFTKYPALTQEVVEPIEFESEQISTCYDFGVIICNKSHASMWSPITFAFPKQKHDDDIWMEISIHRDGHEVFNLSSKYNYQAIFNRKIKLELNDSFIIKYEDIIEDLSIKHSWLYDNNIVGYKPKLSLNMKDFMILSLGHDQKQFDLMESREYLFNIKLDELPTSLDNDYGEGRIYAIDFDSLFPVDKKYVGLTTASWNQKYIGLNPIDQLHNWAAIRELDKDVILCADTFPSLNFISGPTCVISSILTITPDDIDYLLDLVGLEKISRDCPLSNQIIAKRSIIKDLFSFYQQNDILNKITSCIKDRKIVRNPKWTRDNKFPVKRVGAYLTELVTIFWLAQRQEQFMPQEVMRADWTSDEI